MMKKMIWLCLLLCFGCNTNKEEVNVQITQSADKRSIQISGLDNAVLQDIARDSSGSAWQALVPVYKMPADTDLKNYQPVQPGTYHVKDNSVIFTPDTPFAAHQTYFVRYYKYDTANKASDFIMGRNRPGGLHYSDLVFK
ncbi:hypothetical protein SNE25_03885 [Mucilaginibacter sabulilitoris]|uniref:Lipoprotein n=1 Tax=Mucilaginibacter sabulilitoris TaxID=1173583 RepID=A0ABZ0TU14_9SPHI|nr:hypothetical protein [Mucilaginibacter sabulilitoris]WPU94660.1 hypothetical protein SNE25_03885 [Mucilaginibacter sabulilitoris]